MHTRYKTTMLTMISMMILLNQGHFNSKIHIGLDIKSINDHTKTAQSVSLLAENDQASEIMIELSSISPELADSVKRLDEIDGYVRLSYVALAGNPYGVKAGTILGQYRKEVTFDHKQTGGMVLIPAVVNKLLGLTPDKIVIPADISEMPAYDEVRIEPRNTRIDDKVSKNAILVVDTQGNPVSLSNPRLNSSVVSIMNIRNEMMEGADASIVTGPKTMSRFASVVPYVYAQGYFPFGQKMSETSRLFGVGSQTTMASPLTKQSLLSVGEAIVFLKDIEVDQPAFTIERGDPTKQEIALTFDDGGEGVLKILDILNKKGIKATFFLLANELRNHPEQWRQAVKDGHQICNHTLGHRMDLYLLSESEMRVQILGWESAAKDVLGADYLVKMKSEFPYFRSPGGMNGPRLRRVLGQLGYQTVAYWTHEDIWSMFKRNNPNHLTLAQFYINTASNGDILLAHGWTYPYIEETIDGILAKGFRITTLSNILN